MLVLQIKDECLWKVFSLLAIFCKQCWESLDFWQDMYRLPIYANSWKHSPTFVHKPLADDFREHFRKKTLFSPFLQFCESWKRHFSFNPTSQGFLLMNVPTCGIRDLKMVPVATCRWTKLALLLQQESLHLVQPGVRVTLSTLSLLSRSPLILIWPMR